jgi:large subunit ribosomal protein L6
MSRIGKQPVVVPAGVKVRLADGKVFVEGPKGKLEMVPHQAMNVEYDDKTKAVNVKRPDDERLNRALHGMTRALIANMVEGVTKGYEKKLLIEGIGYGGRIDKKSLVLTVGYANSITLTPPDGVTVEVADPTGKAIRPGDPGTLIIVRGADKQKVGQYAAEVRGSRPPEPYKGKGIRYDNEQVRRKEGKSFTSGAA